MKKLFFLFLCSAIGTINMNQGLYAQIKGYSKIEGSFSTIKGSFDGSSFLSSGYSVVSLLPELKAGPGFGVTLGVIRDEMDYSLGFKYALSVLDASYQGFNLGKANFHNFTLVEFTWFFPGEWRNSTRERPILQFHLTTGFEIGILTVKDAFIATQDSIPVKASYTIEGLPIEPGITINFLESCSVNLSVGYRISFAASVKKSGSVDPGTDISGCGTGGFFTNIGVIFPLKFGK
jgi:hypothetical protein